MFYREEFKDLYNYPSYIMGSNYSLLIYHQEDTDIKGYDYNTLNGKRIGVLKRAVQKIERLQEFLTFNNISCELVYYEDTTEYGNCLEGGMVDLMLRADVYMQEEAAAKKRPWKELPKNRRRRNSPLVRKLPTNSAKWRRPTRSRFRQR